MSRRRLADASFGPEWRGFTGMGAWLIQRGTGRERDRMAKLLRQARRDLEAAERRWA